MHTGATALCAILSGVFLTRFFGVSGPARGISKLPPSLCVADILAMHPLAHSAPSQNQQTSTATNVLVVDDDSSVRRVTRSLLQFLGYTVVEANNGSECIHAIKSLKPDIVLLDMMMPVMDGVETLQAIRAFDTTTPVIAMSGGGLVDAELCLRFATKLGARHMLLKPFTADELSAVIDLALKSGANATDS